MQIGKSFTYLFGFLFLHFQNIRNLSMISDNENTS